ncbi:hypothetical protein ACV56Z_10040 [Staphylococcus aureus]
MLEDIKAYLPKEKIWDVFLEVQIGTEVFEVRVGNQRNKYAYTAETSALIHLNNDFYIYEHRISQKTLITFRYTLQLLH